MLWEVNKLLNLHHISMYMTSLEEITTTIAPELEQLNALIRSQLASTNPLMNQVVTTYLTTKGKQIRPIIVILCARMFGAVTDAVLNAAAAVELLHNASLIHDDVVDDSKMRRNRPTLNALWDNHIAVLVGDFFVSTALQRAISTNDLRIIDAIGALGKMLSLGEIDQIYTARNHSLSEDSYFKIIDYKTASLFVACARVGCYAVGASDEQTECLARIAHLLGLCFQIRDDIFDYFEDTKVGKPTGNDLREGKVTLPLLYALTNGSHPDRDAMRALSAKEELDEEEIAALIAFARDCGGIEYAYRRMADLRALAANELAHMPDGPAAEAFIKIFDYIIARDY